MVAVCCVTWRVSPAVPPTFTSRPRQPQFARHISLNNQYFPINSISAVLYNSLFLVHSVLLLGTWTKLTFIDSMDDELRIRTVAFERILTTTAHIWVFGKHFTEYHCLAVTAGRIYPQWRRSGYTGVRILSWYVEDKNLSNAELKLWAMTVMRNMH